MRAVIVIRIATLLLAILPACAPRSVPSESSGPRAGPRNQAQSTSWTDVDRRGLITGRVTLDGKPVRYFGITFTRSYAVPLYLLHTRPTVVRSRDGRFKIRHASGTWDLIIAGPGFARRVIIGKDVNYGKIVLLGEIRVHPGFTIQGRVTDRAGSPVAGATVSIVSSPIKGETDDVLAQLARGTFRTIADDQGHYLFNGVTVDVLSGLSPRVRAGIAGEMSLPYQVPSEDTTIDLEVRPTGTIEGTITGHPGRGYIFARAVSNRGGSLGSSIDSDGRFRIENVPVGDYDVSALPPSLVAAPRSLRVSVVADQAAIVSFTASGP